ncbi:cytochrome P450 [Nemania sp. NC0429]|nr:cytochrome P450 [Nemania sp. NC0429]
MAYTSTVLGLLFSAAIFVYGCARLFVSRRPPNFPPCPPTVPILGNLHQLSSDKQYLGLAELCRKYSSHGLMGLQLGPSTYAVVINSWKVARDLLDHRGAVYSSRPLFPAASLILPPPGDYNLAMLPYGSKWRRERKTTMEFIKESEMEKRSPLEEAESSQFMHELLVEPHRFDEHSLRYHGGIIMISLFGTRAKNFDDNSLVKRYFDLERRWEIVTAPGAVPPYDIFPFLKILPECLTPWRGWKQQVKFLKQNLHPLYRELVDGARERMAQGRSAMCFMQTVLRDREKNEYSDIDIDYLAGALMEAATVTTAASFKSFLLAMAAYPSVLKMAQQEVDAFYGSDKMPTGIVELPYLTACALEIFRWRPVVSDGVPHATTEDDIYEGFFIPANTKVIMNVWGINHDPDEFDNPGEFDPTRFLRHPSGSKASLVQSSGSEVRRSVWTFGGGRRVCPGQEMALRRLLLTMAKCVWCFDIEAVSPDELDTGVNNFKGGAMIPKPFEARFRVRAEDRKRIIESEWGKADAYLKQFE